MAAVFSQLGVPEGSVVAAEAAAPGQLRLVGSRAFDRKAYLEQVAKLRARMPMTEPVVEQMRRDARD